MHEIQEKLIKHLCLYNVLDYESCLYLLDPYELFTPVERSYIFRPLTRQGYLKKRQDGSVTILAKGRSLFPDIKPLVTTGGDKQNLERVMQVSRMAMLLAEIDVPSFGELCDFSWLHFIPSACWRNIAPGILSTTRFLGMLIIFGGRRYAVYDIGDGHMEWQSRAEDSLFNTKHGGYETRADGMLFVCSDEKRIEIAHHIIRQTMWYRKQLLKTTHTERDKPVRWSRAPIRMKANYRHVYLTTYKTLRQSIMRIHGENTTNPLFCVGAERLTNPAQGDYENWPYRYFCNPACDLLKFANFFSVAKDTMQLHKSMPHIPKEPYYAVCIKPEDRPILEMYSDVMNMEGLKIYEYPDR